MNQYEFKQPPTNHSFHIYLMNKQLIQLNQINSEIKKCDTLVHKEYRVT